MVRGRSISLFLIAGLAMVVSLLAAREAQATCGDYLQSASHGGASEMPAHGVWDVTYRFPSSVPRCHGPQCSGRSAPLPSPTTIVIPRGAERWDHFSGAAIESSIVIAWQASDPVDLYSLLIAGRLFRPPRA